MKYTEKQITINYGHDGAESYFEVSSSVLGKNLFIKARTREKMDIAIQHFLWAGGSHAGNGDTNCPVCLYLMGM